MIYISESWILSTRQRTTINSLDMRLLRRTQDKRDKIGNEALREELQKPLTGVNVQHSQLRWFGYVLRIRADRLVREVYEAKRKTKKRV